jgi:protein PhnA
MPFPRYPELSAFLSARFPDTDPEQDEETTSAFATSSPNERRAAVLDQIRRLASDPQLSIESLGAESNRWFSDLEEARRWLGRIATALGPDLALSASIKDCHGAVLAEGDSVQVIQDLKVKGGSTDLKRGTMIKKIHLTDAPDSIECRVNGSTLVLKTCFLKKA